MSAKTKRKGLEVLLFGLLAICFLSGCDILFGGGGMDTVDPPSLHEENPDSVLNDLSPIRARDLMLPAESASGQDSRRSD